MFGLVVLIVSALYLTVMVIAVRWAWRTGLAGDGSRSRAFRFAALALLVVYLPMFWDHIPTLALHRYMCARDAGFTAYVDAKEWRAKNADAVATVSLLTRDEREASVEARNTPDGFERTITFGGLLARDQKFERVVPWLTVVRKQQRITGMQDGVILAAATDYGGGNRNPNDLRWWLRTGSCVARPSIPVDQQAQVVEPFEFFWQFVRMLKGEQS